MEANFSQWRCKIFINKSDNISDKVDSPCWEIKLSQDLSFVLIFFLRFLSVKLDEGGNDDLNKRNQLAHHQPHVDHLDVGGGGQALHLADEDRCHHQHGGQVHTQGCLEEEGLEEGGGVGDHHEEERGEVGGHHLAHDLPLQYDRHFDSLSRSIYIVQHLISDTEKCHIF